MEPWPEGEGDRARIRRTSGTGGANTGDANAVGIATSAANSGAISDADAFTGNSGAAVNLTDAIVVGGADGAGGAALISPSTPWTWPSGSREERLDGLVHHTDRGSQYTSIRYTERLAEVHAVASVGSRGDSYDCEHDPPAGRSRKRHWPSLAGRDLTLAYD